MVIIYRIIRQRLFAPPFRGFLCMMIVVLWRDAVVSIPSYDSHAYTVAWEWTLPVLLIAQACAGLDTLNAVERLYRTFGRLVIRLYLFCLAISLLISGAALPFELRRVTSEEAQLRSLFLLQRCVDSWIALTLILVSLFLARFTAPSKKPSRNLVLHTILLSAYFAGYAALFIAENLTALGGAVILERVQFVLVVLLYASWAAGISKQGAESEPWPQIDVILLRRTGAVRR
jgi:hypothetical protein